jgi:hypothetical protein
MDVRVLLDSESNTEKVMSKKQSPWASEEETRALIVPDTRTPAQKKLDGMLDKRGAWEQGAEPYKVLYQIAIELLEREAQGQQEPIEVWREEGPTKRGTYRVRRIGEASINYGYAYWNGDRWGSMCSTRQYAQDSKGIGRKTPSRYPMQWLQKGKAA